MPPNKLGMLSDEEYVAKGGGKCPNCGSNEVQAIGPVQADYTNCWGAVRCDDCGKEWRDVYTLIGYEPEEDE